jgi:hypothetical protein
MPVKRKQNAVSERKQKSCLGCGDKFLTYRNYDYCQDCAINDNRYAQNKCSECGDGSGKVKFKNQLVRPCKLCSLTQKMNKKPSKLTPEQQF